MIGFMIDLAKAAKVEDLMPLLPKEKNVSFLHGIKMTALSSKITKIIPRDLGDVRHFTAQCGWVELNLSMVRAYVQTHGIGDFFTLCNILIVLLQDVQVVDRHPDAFDAYKDVVYAPKAFTQSDRTVSVRDLRLLFRLITDFQRDACQNDYPYLDLVLHLLVEQIPEHITTDSSVRELLQEIRSVKFTLDAIMVLLDHGGCSLCDLIGLLQDEVFDQRKGRLWSSMMSFEICMSSDGTITSRFGGDPPAQKKEDPHVVDLYHRIWKDVINILRDEKTSIVREQIYALSERIFDLRGDGKELAEMEDAMINALLRSYGNTGDTSLKIDVTIFPTVAGAHRFIAAFLQERTAITHEQMLILSHAIRSCDHGGGTLLERLQRMPFSDDVNGR